ncbi:unnamed protein product [Mytilus edulis]|uniref:Uncharacterized protein n=1 Tax=Mytilus edulis TaxID=6550 RepID=A0A8S3UY40_MYTED|nr:unnamed protein product [Mytilus edulis]
MDNAEGDSGSTRGVMTSFESDARLCRWDSRDLPRTLDRGVLHNQGTTYQALPLTSRGRFRVGNNGTDHEHRTAINKWSDKEKALELATSLRGTAQSILADLRPEMRTKLYALSSLFQPENQAEIYRAHMKSKILGHTEQIPVLGQDITRLVRLAYPSIELR